MFVACNTNAGEGLVILVVCSDVNGRLDVGQITYESEVLFDDMTDTNADI